MKLLMGIPSPRDNIAGVSHYSYGLPIDVLTVKYFKEYVAYQIIRDYFLSHDYTHLLIKGDDVIVTKKHYEQLIKDVEELNPPVISGIMNVDEDQEKDCYNITEILPMKIGTKPVREGLQPRRMWHWIKDISNYNNIFEVGFVGLNMTLIARELVEKIDFFTEGRYKGRSDKDGCCIDLTFCWECKEKNIPVLVDKRVLFQHKRYAGEIMVGKKLPIVTLTK